MAKNLDDIVNNFSDKTFIVWLANAPMSKFEYDFMKGKTMGSQFVEMNPNISYHIAFSSIHMPYRRREKLKRQEKTMKISFTFCRLLHKITL